MGTWQLLRLTTPAAKTQHVGRCQAQDRSGAAEALGGVPRGEEGWNRAEAEAVSGGQSEARGEPGEGGLGQEVNTLGQPSG